MKRIVFLRAACFLLALITSSVVTGRVSYAHIGADNMPDSVAIMEYRIYLEFKPDDTEVRNKLGMVYFRSRKLKKAARAFSEILQLDPENFDSLDGMGLVKAALEDYDAADRYHRQALAVNAKDMMAWYHLGLVLAKKGELMGAKEAYQTALKLFDEQETSTDGDGKTAEFGGKIQAALTSVNLKLKVKRKSEK